MIADHWWRQSFVRDHAIVNRVADVNDFVILHHVSSEPAPENLRPCRSAKSSRALRYSAAFFRPRRRFPTAQPIDQANPPQAETCLVGQTPPLQVPTFLPRP